MNCTFPSLDNGFQDGKYLLPILFSCRPALPPAGSPSGRATPHRERSPVSHSGNAGRCQCVPQLIRGGVGFEVLNLRTDAKLRRFKGQPCFAPLRHPKAAEIVLRKRDRRAGKVKFPFRGRTVQRRYRPSRPPPPFRKGTAGSYPERTAAQPDSSFQICFHLPRRGRRFPHNGGKGILRCASLHRRLDILSELLHRQSELRP